MMNLLPLEEKKKITREYHARLVVVATCLFGIVIVLGIIMLTPSYITLLLKKKTIVLALGTPILEERARAYDTLSAELEEANRKLSILEDSASAPRIFENVIVPITARRGGVLITGIVYEKNTAGAKIARVNGVAKNREDLRTFIKMLEEEAYFTRVETPVSNFVKDKDIEFSLEISVENQ